MLDAGALLIVSAGDAEGEAALALVGALRPGAGLAVLVSTSLCRGRFDGVPLPVREPADGPTPDAVVLHPPSPLSTLVERFHDAGPLFAVVLGGAAPEEIGHVRERGGIVLALDGSGVEGADVRLPANQLAGHLETLLRQHRDAVTAAEDAEALEAIVDLLSRQGGPDFRHYKQATIGRRVRRRMSICGLRRLPGYHDRLMVDEAEVAALVRDCTIKVTRLFRDPEAWEALVEPLTRRLRELPEGETLRCWVAGCASGEEAYTLAMVADEAMRRAGVVREVRVFATDIDEEVIARAGRGSYPCSALEDLDGTRRARYFTVEGGRCRVTRELRERVTFARHDLLRDPPFTRMDVVSCRNLLVYLEGGAQGRALAALTYATNPGGLVLLGSSESPSGFDGALRPLDERLRLFARREGPRAPLARHYREVHVARAPSPAAADGVDATLERLCEHLVARTAEVGLLVSRDLHLLRSFGDPEGVLRVSPGVYSSALGRLLNNDVRTALMTGLHRARRTAQAVTLHDVPVTLRQGRAPSEVRIEPLGGDGEAELFLALVSRPERDAAAPPPAARVGVPADDARVAELERDLVEAQAALQVTLDEYQTTNEDLQSTNEELLAANEELQTANEELQSLNEELNAVNAEHQEKIQELSRLTEDFENLLRAADIGTLFVDRELRLRKVTPAAAETFNVTPTDVGRPLAHFTHRLDVPDLLEQVARVVETGELSEHEVRRSDGRTLLLRLRPFVVDDAVAGAVLTLVDVTELREAQAGYSERSRLLREFVRRAPVPVTLRDLDGRFIAVSETAADGLGLTAAQMNGARIQDLLPSEMAERALAQDEALAAPGSSVMVSTWRAARQGGDSVTVAHRFAVRDDSGRTLALATIGLDITEQEDAKAEVERLNAELEQRVAERTAALAAANARLARFNEDLQQFVYIASHDLRVPLNSVALYLGILEEDHGDEFGEEAREILERAVKVAERTHAMLDELRLYTRVSRGDDVQEPVDLGTVAQEVMLAMAPQIESLRGRVTVGALPRVQGSRAWAHLLFQNLVHNGLRYNDSAAPAVHIDAEERDGQLQIYVRDNGIGIPEGSEEECFQLFRRLNPGDGSREGTGAGLAIVRRIVEGFGGRIWVERAEGGGSVFRFTVDTE